MSTTGEYRQLTPADVEEAAQVIAQSFVDDPLTSFMLPFKRTRIKTPSNAPYMNILGPNVWRKALSTARGSRSTR